MSLFFKIMAVGGSTIIPKILSLFEDQFWNPFEIAFEGNLHATWECQLTCFRVNPDFKPMIV